MNENKLKVHKLKLWRVGQNLTQLQLAQKLGYATAGIIQGIEAGQFEPKIGEVAKLCQLSNYQLTLWDFVPKEIAPENAPTKD